YESLKDYIASIDSLRDNSYPLPVPDKPGAAAIHNVTQKYPSPVIQKNDRLCTCCRCGKAFCITKDGTQVDDECVYHFGRIISKKVSGEIVNIYSCCDGAVGGAGCSISKSHVHRYNGDMSSGYVATISSATAENNVYALDCEMCYTANGIELCRVTMVDHNAEVVYDSLVRPSSRIIDYNTRFSGITESDMNGINVTLRDAQAIILSYVYENTIIVGHGLENDLISLKLIHKMIVDTALVFPHRRGLPYKRSLKNLARDFLKRIIQNSGDDGHDSKEDAVTCIDLMKWKLKNGKRSRSSSIKHVCLQKPRC
ncbi:uncharacterized protein TRIADDRAFT_28004, partial [Trichoplax adhaerens]